VRRFFYAKNFERRQYFPYLAYTNLHYYMTDVTKQRANLNMFFLVMVASLGYFVDIYDLLLFSITRTQSLKDIGIAAADVKAQGTFIFNVQMFGLLLGGILWGIVGDKFGRIKVLFGSILLYSIANFFNAYVHDVNTYAIVRFFAGIGLAGELGAGITLVSETMSKEKRGYGTMIVAVVGLFGAVLANLVYKTFGWHNAYLVGGAFGLVLLALRMGTFESGMFKNAEKSNVSRGNFLMLFNDKKRFLKYLYCILIGAPLWYVVGILVTLSPEFGKALGAKELLNAGDGVMYTYIGISIGDLLAGILAQITKSRRLTMLVFLLLTVVTVVIYLTSKGLTSSQFTWICFFMGCSVGYWATFVTIASEQFGTNLRATVTTTVPNFVRGMLIPINTLFGLFTLKFGGMVNAGYVMLALLTGLALFSLSQLKETFGKDLNYMEGEVPVV